MNRTAVASELVKIAKSLVAESIPWHQELIGVLGPQFEYQSRSNYDWAIFKWRGSGRNTDKILTIAEDLIDRARLGDFRRIEVTPSEIRGQKKDIELHINL